MKAKVFFVFKSRRRFRTWRSRRKFAPKECQTVEFDEIEKFDHVSE